MGTDSYCPVVFFPLRGSSDGLSVLEVDRPETEQDDRRLLRREGEVVHAGRQLVEPARRQCLVASCTLRQLVAHAEGQRAGDHDHVLVGRVRVRRDGVVGRELQPDTVGTALCGVAGEHGKLRSRRDERRRRTPLGFTKFLDDMTRPLGSDYGQRAAAENGCSDDDRRD